ncbi:probable UDP-glucosyl transferase 73B6 [Phragmites australis]|uniref:probable UDP-glucosyl transferase 73B6 n=1 Tax=Phragmites australis TaxID=29695 RepID=UPI002D7977BF|nr:probable UDP-glucosyl transferase 73B6 [Phragmites australis]
MAAAVVDSGKRLRVFFLPSFALGHLIPMADLACRMAAARPAEVEATVVVTPANAARIAPTVTRTAAAGHAVHVLCYPFPDVGLEEGIECLGDAAAHDAWRVYRAVEQSQTIHEPLLRHHRPDAIVSDVPFWWTTEIAAELGVPRFTFHPVGVFPQLAMNNLFTIRPDIVRGGSASRPVSVPGFPGKEITIPVSELPTFLVQDDHLSMSWDRMKASQLACFGVIVNTFIDLEQPYCDEFSRVDARRSYFVGPVAQPSRSAVHRGGDGNADCLRWLSTKPSRSVVYVCFGSWAHFSVTQIKELALGLEASNQPFLWVIRSDDSNSLWAPAGWEQRVAGRGMVVRGWAPQLAVLAHQSVGAFVTHCGWNSILEAASAGVPVLTWPLVFEQFINERLVTEVAAFGARVWDGGKRSERDGEAETVPAEAIARAVAGFMEAGGQWEKTAARARELAERACAAVNENGSSWRDIHRLVDDLVQARASGPETPQGNPVNV